MTLRLSEYILQYFKAMADKTDVPYENLINLYLHGCLANCWKKRIKGLHAIYT